MYNYTSTVNTIAVKWHCTVHSKLTCKTHVTINHTYNSNNTTMITNCNNSTILNYIITLVKVRHFLKPRRWVLLPIQLPPCRCARIYLHTSIYCIQFVDTSTNIKWLCIHCLTVSNNFYKQTTKLTSSKLI